MICEYCHGHLGFGFSHGLSMTEICLGCGNTRRTSKLVMALL